MGGGGGAVAGTGGAISGGEGGEAGAPINGGAGAGGEGGTPEPPIDVACSVALECEPGESCEGTASGQVCVPRSVVCPGACPRNNGCNADGSCVAPLALGAECTSNTQCAVGSRCWYVGEEAIKHCVALGTLDARCKLDEDCATGLGCSLEQAEGKCAPLAQENQRCTNLSCEPGLFCARNAAGTLDVCRTTPAGAAGSWCDAEALNPKCNLGFACDTDNTCKKLGALGQSCSGALGKFACEEGAFCASDSKCHSVTPGVGEPCLDLGLYSAAGGVHCQAGAYCREESNSTCVAETPLGQTCDSTRACANNGFCGPAGTCVAAAALGASCAGVDGNPGTCAEGFCGTGLKCQALVADGASCAAKKCPRYGYCPNPCNAGSYCSTESNLCFKSPVKDGDCVPHVNGDNHFLCQGQWCCASGQVCNDATKCSDSPAPVGKSCLAKSGAAIACVAGAFCNAAHVCQAYVGTHGECSEANKCAVDAVCRTGEVGGTCE